MLGTLLFLTFEYDKWGIGILIKINEFSPGNHLINMLLFFQMFLD